MALLDGTEELCACEKTGPTSPDDERQREIGTDETDGRFAYVEGVRCTRCQRLLVNYLVENEAFSRSGRWATVLIDERLALTITPEEVPSYLENAPWYVYGGSYFGVQIRIGAGKMKWGN